MKIFIGSSSEAKDSGHLDLVASWIEEFGHEPKPWTDHDLFPLGAFTFSSLHNAIRMVDAAIFIFTLDDKIWYRGSTIKAPRDNVILEYGLFSGGLGKDGVIILVGGTPRTKIPTDLEGVTWGNLSNPANLKIKVKQWIDRLMLNLHGRRSHHIRYWKNKWSMPDSNKFWRDLSATATKRFCLIGQTNKSWIARDHSEAEKFGKSIINILEKGGIVSIVSASQSVPDHEKFLVTHVLQNINCQKPALRRRLKKALTESLTYSTEDNITYRATLSDTRLLLLPNLYSEEFRDDSMVIEVLEAQHESFEYYLQDINRLTGKRNQDGLIKRIAGMVDE